MVYGQTLARACNQQRARHSASNVQINISFVPALAHASHAAPKSPPFLACGRITAAANSLTLLKLVPQLKHKSSAPSASSPLNSAITWAQIASISSPLGGSPSRTTIACSIKLPPLGNPFEARSVIRVGRFKPSRCYPRAEGSSKITLMAPEHCQRLERSVHQCNSI